MLIINNGPKNFMQVVIPRNSRTPVFKSKIVTTSLDYQTSVRFSIYEGESCIITYNNYLGEFTLENIPPAPKGVPRFDTVFSIDSNGILTVSAHDVSTGLWKGITINRDRRSFF